MRSFRCPHCKLEHTAWAELPSEPAPIRVQYVREDEDA